MEIIFVRHGQTDWNLQHKIQGRTDIELNQIGINQAIETAEKLKFTDIDLIISSPLKRALQTAEIIAGERNIPIITDERIAERCFGEFERMMDTAFDEKEFWSYSKNKKYEKAECIKDFFHRIYGFIDELKEKYEYKRILIASHGGVSIPFRCYFEGIPNQYTLIPLCIKNCEIAKFDI